MLVIGDTGSPVTTVGTASATKIGPEAVRIKYLPTPSIAENRCKIPVVIT